jgi:hypothetical protein
MALPDDVYRVLFGHRLMFHNRLAPGEVTALFEAAGFEPSRRAASCSPTSATSMKAPRQRAKPVCPPGSRAGVCRGSRAKDRHTAAMHYLYRKPVRS